MSGFEMFVSGWFVAGLSTVLLGLYRFRRKNDHKAWNFLVRTRSTPKRVAVFTLLFGAVAIYSNATVVLLILVVNHLVAVIQHSLMERWEKEAEQFVEKNK